MRSPLECGPVRAPVPGKSTPERQHGKDQHTWMQKDQAQSESDGQWEAFREFGTQTARPQTQGNSMEQLLKQPKHHALRVNLVSFSRVKNEPLVLEKKQLEAGPISLPLCPSSPRIQRVKGATWEVHQHASVFGLVRSDGSPVSSFAPTARE